MIDTPCSSDRRLLVLHQLPGLALAPAGRCAEGDRAHTIRATSHRPVSDDHGRGVGLCDHAIAHGHRRPAWGALEAVEECDRLAAMAQLEANKRALLASAEMWRKLATADGARSDGAGSIRHQAAKGSSPGQPRDAGDTGWDGQIPRHRMTALQSSISRGPAGIAP